ncbi:ubiquitin carboxyl-terminal hydrolase 34 isoform X3 [Xiphophorus hellerii]|uniref:ubiquitin carboxyl-terminal hydrolase 34 isoform X3 n=1 Tax=Xiphophorus hellerii TaxID=8084 RepID=UPI0013B36673|nr:ubiquitin carboxyl-terminal hydrolase 34 isoform X3 [Xiphophorus hellerii]
MCENCAELVEVLNELSDADGSEGGFQLKKEHALRVLGYISSWSQRQCLCCFKEYKHLEVFNQLVYALINLVITQINSLRNQLCSAQNLTHKGSGTEEGRPDWAAGESAPGSLPQPASPGEDEPVNVERDSAEEDANIPDPNQKKTQSHEQEKIWPDGAQANPLGPLDGGSESLNGENAAGGGGDNLDPFSSWTTEEKEKLLLCAAKIFQIQFPLYTAYKHNTHPTIEDISAHESNILGSFCDMNDVEVPLHLLRYVCLFCGKHGLSLMKECFELGTPESLPFPIAHAFITIVSNIRIWLHIPAVMQHIIPFRTYVIRYLCKLSDQELRQSAARNMADLMWSTVKEPLDSALCFDKESLDLAFKYFMSPTLTMRLAGLSQITNQLHTFNDVCNNESLVSDTETSIAKELADWLIHNNVVEHIFGPNLHIEIIKQCQVILNFLAAEGRLSTQHIDCIWAAAQLKHCSRYIHDLFPSLIKNLDPVPLRHVLNLVSGLHPSAHTEQTLYLASMLIKALWNNALAAKAQLSKQSSFASLLNTNLPMGNKKGSPAASPDSSDNSDTQHSGGSDMEMDDQMMVPSNKRSQQRLSDTEESMQGSSDETANSVEEGSSGPGSSSGRSEASSNEAASSRASQSAGSPGSELHSDDMADSEALKEEEEDEEEDDEEDEDDDEEDDDEGNASNAEDGQQKEGHTETRKRKAGEALGEGSGHGVGSIGSGGGAKTKVLQFSPETSAAMVTAASTSLEGRMRLLDACSSSSSARAEAMEPQQPEDISPSQMGQGPQEPPCLPRPGDFLGGAMSSELFNCRRFIGPQHHHHHHHHHHEGPMVEDMLSADDVSCSSSQVSAKSEKNMADFDGEESGCEEELVQINSHAELSSHLQQHLPNLASIYHEHLVQGPAVHKHQYSSHAVTDINLDNVCKKGNTLLWDLVQDEDAIHLSEGLINEAEKLLCSLVCWFTDRQIRMRFIEGCLDNLAHHRSVVVSLRLLPKLFGTFQQFGSSYDTHWITMWAEKELHMMKLFFDNLQHYIQEVREHRHKFALYSHSAEVQVRLQFLTCVFSTLGSPDHFRLSLEQVDILWHCLVEDAECYDDALHWFLNQVRSKDQHAMGMETYKHLFLEKMPQLKPETISMTGLNLFQHLCNLARLATSTLDNASNCELCGMDQLWGIALRAQSADISRAAIQYINSYYINAGKTGLEKEQEFIRKCMESLLMASANLEKDAHSSLTSIERGLLMLKTHLEAFRRRFAYHLRQWQIEGTGISSHLKALSDKQSLPLRIVCQPAGLPDKMTIEMYPSDQVADLRAEVTHWYENLQKEQMNQQAQLQEFGQSSRQQGDFPGGLMGPVRMISSGHELTTDYDEKTLHELGFKDMQMVFVSLGAPRRERKGEGVQLPASCLPPPQKEHIPMLLLLQEPHLTTLFDLLEMLACFKPPSPNTEKLQESPESARCEELHLHAENLSRRVWELLMLLPTCPKMLQAFQNISDETLQSGESLCWKELLRIKSPHKLLYALEIIEALGKPNRRIHRESTGSYSDLYPDSDDSSEDQIENSKNTWSCKFVSSGGLQLLLEIFNSGILEPKDQESWTVWQLDCLACLLKLICQFAVDPADLDLAYHDVFSWSGLAESQRKRAWPGKSRKSTVEHGKGLHIPRLTEVFLSLVQGTNLIQRLINVAYTYDNLAHRVLKAQSDHRSRHEVTHYSMWLLVSWAHCSSTVKSSLADSDHLHDWLKKLTLLVPEPAVRHEACNGLYKLSLSGLEGGESINRSFLLLAASTLLKFLPDAQALKPLRVEDYEEEPLLRTGCKEYFWLLCKLIDNIHVKDASQKVSPSLSLTGTMQTTLLDLDALARHLADCIRSREILDQQDGNIEDDGLTGLLRLATSVLKHKPPFKFSREGQEFLRDVYNLLFLLPSLADRAQPKCKSHSARAAAYDLLVEMVKGSVENYRLLHNWVMSQHMQSSHAPYKWDYWPHDDVRAECRFVGLTNLGATCYMASTIQQLYMIPEARQAVFTAKYSEEIKHKTTLLELQKMFTYLMESERKAYNPRPFCKTYTMDKQPLNTGEQKDMTEFFTDLITKIEEMSQELKNTVKTLFGGVITNNVVSLDCDHVSQTAEEFYTVRCQVADMKNIYESLDEVTIKDTLEGDNMYTCSQCGKKVRAEKRACFKKLPRILSFNTMRYTFNMVTMMKEKVNTHFSFPLRLDMTPYTEDFLMGKGERKEGFREEREQSVTESYEYDLIGVTVHTGTADGGHYYSFIRDIVNPHAYKNNKWYLFNDAEVKPFDSAQLASECFGGEMTTKTYDSVTDKFMDFSFEKTHSAYMLFYKRVELEEENGKDFSFDVSPDLLEWIWHDNMQFLQDKNIFEHTYFGFMWQLCSSIPSTLPDPKAVSLMTAKLSTSFVLETFIHSKEKPTMLQWIELLTKQFNNNQAACEWFLDRMADDNWWPMQILIKCPNQIVRQMFQRLCIHVIQRLRPVHAHLYLQPGMEDGSDDMDGPVEDIGSRSCVTRFVKTLLSIMEHGVKPHSKHLTEYFAFLYEFAKMGEEESQFLLSLQAISIMVHFYMGTKGPENPQVEVLSEEEAEEEDEEEDILSLAEEKYRPAALEKMIALIALLVEQSRHLTLSQSDMAALTGGKGFPFLFQHIRDGINIRQTCNLIFSLCRYNNRLAEHIVSMLFTSIAKLTPEAANPFFKLLTMLMEFAGGPPGMPSFASYILQRIWEVIEYNPSQCLDWLAVQTPRNKLAHSWVLQNMENWVERFLLAHNYPRVRTSAAYLLVSLIPSNSFRQMFRSTRSLHLPTRELPLSPDTTVVLHQVYNLLLGLLGRAKLYVDASVHGTTKLVQYFSFMTYCLISKTEKLMFSGYFMDLWNLFQPKLSEPAIATNHNKQALLSFWYNVCVDCPENVRLVVQNPVVTKNIAFNYILADHDDQEVVLFNRGMLPAYYGILRMCCEQSPTFTRQLASHQNIQWAFKNLTPHASQYPGAVEELFNLMQLFVAQRVDMKEEELDDIKQFKKTTISCYLRCLDGRSCWTTLISAFRVLLENDEDRLLVVFNRGLILMTESFNTLHMMYHEATACHVTGDLVELLSIFLSVLKSTRPYLQRKDVKQALIQWQERIDFAHKLLTLLNSYSPPELRNACLDVLKELVLLSPHDFLHTLVPFLQHNHCTYHHSNIPMSFGPYLPCRENIKLMGAKNNIRPPRPELNMCLLPSLVESSKGKDEVYDRMLLDYFLSYHQFIHLLCRVAINCEKFTDTLVKLSVLIAYEGLPLHLALFPKLWTELCQSQSVLAKTCVKLLCDDPAFSEYIKCILMDERTFLNNNVVYSFLTCFLPKLQVLSGPSCSNLISVLVTNLLTEQSNLQPELALHRVELNKTSSLLNADLRSLVLLLSIQPPPSIDAALCPALQELLGRCRLCLQQRSSLELEAKDLKSKAEDEGATPVKRRRVSSDDDRAADAAAPLCMASSSSSSALPVCGDPKPDQQEALTPASTSDTETRDSSSLIDPGTEQDPPSPEPTPATSRNMDSALKEEKMEVSSSSSSSFSSSSSSSLLQDAGDGFVQVEEPEAPQPGGTGEEREEERRRTEPQPPTAADGEAKDSAAAAANVSGSAPTLPEDATSPSAIGLAGDGSEGAGTSQVILSGGAPPPDMLDMLHRTVEATITIVTKLSVKATPSS